MNTKTELDEDFEYKESGPNLWLTVMLPAAIIGMLLGLIAFILLCYFYSQLNTH